MKTALYKTKDYPELDLKVWKYTRAVFFKGLWTPELCEYRGLVTNMGGTEIISYPFTKVFNLGERGTTVDLELEVICPRKINGFMAAATWHKGEILVSTTGTLDSDFVALAKKYIKSIPLLSGMTFIFEIVDPRDPHIVPEVPGAYLIGARLNELGSPLVSEEQLDRVAKLHRYQRPEVWSGKFKDLPLDVKHEGYMVRDASTGQTLCKVKSKYYLFTKFWMRSKKAYSIQEVEEEFYPLVEKIRSTFTLEEWSELNEQERRGFIECYI